MNTEQSPTCPRSHHVSSNLATPTWPASGPHTRAVSIWSAWPAPQFLLRVRSYPSESRFKLSRSRGRVEVAPLARTLRFLQHSCSCSVHRFVISFLFRPSCFFHDNASSHFQCWIQAWIQQRKNTFPLTNDYFLFFSLLIMESYTVASSRLQTLLIFSSWYYLNSMSNIFFMILFQFSVNDQRPWLLINYMASHISYSHRYSLHEPVLK